MFDIVFLSPIGGEFVSSGVPGLPRLLKSPTTIHSAENVWVFDEFVVKYIGSSAAQLFSCWNEVIGSWDLIRHNEDDERSICDLRR